MQPNPERVPSKASPIPAKAQKARRNRSVQGPGRATVSSVVLARKGKAVPEVSSRATNVVPVRPGKREKGAANPVRKEKAVVAVHSPATSVVPVRPGKKVKAVANPVSRAKAVVETSATPTRKRRKSQVAVRIPKAKAAKAEVNQVRRIVLPRSKVRRIGPNPSLDQKMVPGQSPSHALKAAARIQAAGISGKSTRSHPLTDRAVARKAGAAILQHSHEKAKTTLADGHRDAGPAYRLLQPLG